MMCWCCCEGNTNHNVFYIILIKSHRYESRCAEHICVFILRFEVNIDGYLILHFVFSLGKRFHWIFQMIIYTPFYEISYSRCGCG